MFLRIDSRGAREKRGQLIFEQSQGIGLISLMGFGIEVARRNWPLDAFLNHQNLLNN